MITNPGHPTLTNANVPTLASWPISPLHPPYALLLLALLRMSSASVSSLSSVLVGPETYRDIYQTIDERQTNVLSLGFGSAIISSAISALPDDMGTALSSEYGDFYTGFAIVAGALLLEKYLLTTLGFGFFGIIVPICCGLMIGFP